MKYHTAFTNIDTRMMTATKELMRGWGAADITTRWQRSNTWLDSAAGIYGINRPKLSKVRTGTGFYELSTNRIGMSKPSIVTLLHEFRHSMQNQGTQHFEDVEDDARAWSLSIYYAIAPRTFNRLVLLGEILHVDINDLT